MVKLRTLPKILFILLLATPFAFAAEEAGSRLFERSYSFLFTINRSTNSNRLIYEARFTPEGYLDPDPVHVYWIMDEENGEIESLTGFEKSWAYGVIVKSVSDESAVFSLKAIPSREITLRTFGKPGELAARATMLINGTEGKIESIYIQTKGKGLIPSVSFVEIRGTSLKDGSAISERIEE